MHDLRENKKLLTIIIIVNSVITVFVMQFISESHFSSVARKVGSTFQYHFSPMDYTHYA